jgi:hypothetical protein
VEVRLKEKYVQTCIFFLPLGTEEHSNRAFKLAVTMYRMPR